MRKPQILKQRSGLSHFLRQPQLFYKDSISFSIKWLTVSGASVLEL